MRRDLALLFLVALLVRALAAAPQAGPGYMDAAYYTLGAQRLAEGFGFSEMVLWNYLDDPWGVPHPSHLYWMPLPSLLAAGPMALLGASYRAAQAAFVLLSALVPVLAYLVSWGLAPDRRRALTVAGLALFSGYYVIYWGVPEAFAPFALAGAACLAATGLALRDERAGWYAAAGATAALGHLARADGMLLLAPAALAVLVRLIRGPRRGAALRGGALVLGAYLLVMAPWFWRNLQVAGQPLPTRGTAALWLRGYDELYSYGWVPSLQSYLAWGWANILSSKLEALRLNVLNFVLANNLVFLLPFTLVGARRLWRHALVWPALVYGLALYAAMTFAFTFPGMRGGALHSSAALLPAIFAVATAGLDASVAWLAQRRRGWRAAEAQAVFAAGAVLLALGLSAWLYSARVLGAGGLADPDWNHAYDTYERAAVELRARGETAGLVMVNDPPAFTYLTGIPSAAVPNEKLETVLAAAGRYGVRYVLLDQNRPAPLAGEYAGIVSTPGMTEAFSFEDRAGRPVRVWRVEERQRCRR